MFDNKINSIINNRTSGSTEILQNLIDYFLNNIITVDERLLLDLANRFKSFQIINEFLSDFKKYIHLKNSDQIVEYLKTVSQYSVASFNDICNNALPYFKNKTKFVSISNSKTLQFIFNDYSKIESNLALTILESRPQFEGRILAKALVDVIKIEIVTEAMAANAVESCDAVVIGADKILNSGVVTNKTGSRNLAILANYFHKPFYVLADKKKFTDDENYERDFHSSEEIWNSDAKNIDIYNYYFEKIEAGLITKIISN